jgi:hypothetical protein
MLALLVFFYLFFFQRQEFLRMQRSQIAHAPTSFAPSYYPPRIGDPTMSYYPGPQSTLIRATNPAVPYTSGGGRGGYNGSFFVS